MTARSSTARPRSRRSRPSSRTASRRSRERGVVPGLGTVLVGDDPGSQLVRQRQAQRLRARSASPASAATCPRRPPRPRSRRSSTSSTPTRPAPASSCSSPPGSTRWPCSPGSTRRRTSTACTRPTSAGSSWASPAPLPCTPMGCIELLRRFDVPIAGAKVVIVGRGLTVGRPLGLHPHPQVGERDRHPLPHRDPGPRRAGAPGRHRRRRGRRPRHHHRRHGQARCRGARRRRQPRVDGKIAGDVAADVAEVAGWLSPNPGGVGPMTRAMLLTQRRRRPPSGRPAWGDAVRLAGLRRLGLWWVIAGFFVVGVGLIVFAGRLGWAASSSAWGC